MEVGFNSRANEPDWYAKTSIAYLKDKLKEIGWEYVKKL
jgi:protein FrlC